MNRSKNRFPFSKIHTTPLQTQFSWLTIYSSQGHGVLQGLALAPYGYTQDPAGPLGSCAEQLNGQILAVLLLSDFPNINFYRSQGKRATGKPNYSSQGFLCGPSLFFPIKEVFYNSAVCKLDIHLLPEKFMLRFIQSSPKKNTHNSQLGHFNFYTNIMTHL